MKALFLALLFFTQFVHGNPVQQTFKLERGTIHIMVPEYWQTANTLFGIPLTLLGPEKAGRRPVITIVPTGKAEIVKDRKNKQKLETEYRLGREAWLKKNHGKSIEYYPYVQENKKNGDEITQMGF